jgi:hypothetical protein
MDEKPEPLRIGVIVSPKPKLNEAALRSIVLAMNKEQDLLQFEFYDIDIENPVMARVAGHEPVDRGKLRQMLPDFVRDLRQDLSARCADYELSESVPDRYVIVSQCRFDDNYYSLRRGPCSVLALGNWRRYMAPPSLLEFVQVLLVREAVAALCTSLSGSVHLGNKGCLMDFTSDLSEVRQKVLAGYICHFCSSRMLDDGQPQLPAVASNLIDRKWLGSPVDPRSPAGVAANLGSNLFIVKGLRATARERIFIALQEEGAKQIAVVVGLVMAAVIIFLLGIKATGLARMAPSDSRAVLPGMSLSPAETLA